MADGQRHAIQNMGEGDGSSVLEPITVGPVFLLQFLAMKHMDNAFFTRYCICILYLRAYKRGLTRDTCEVMIAASLY
jgi:hypothetical protein